MNSISYDMVQIYQHIVDNIYIVKIFDEILRTQQTSEFTHSLDRVFFREFLLVLR